MKGEGSRPDDHALVEHRDFVEALARRLVFDQHLADDLVQETLLAAMKNPPRERGALRGWLARVVRNLAYRTLRTRERRGRRERSAARPEAVPGAGDLVARLTWHRKVVDAVIGLPEPYRTTLLLRFYEDLAPKEIAEKQGVPGATVRSRLKRGLALMRDRLDAEHGGDRRAWTLGLLPLLFPSQPAAAAVATGGAVVGVAAMSVQKKAMVAVALVLALVGTFVAGRRVLQAGGERTARTTVRAVPASDALDAADGTPVTPVDAEANALIVLVRDGFGEPIPGAKVEVLAAVPYPDPKSGPWFPNDLPEHSWIERSRAEVVCATFRAGEDGRAVLRGAPVHDVYVRASHPGYGTRSHWVWGEPDDEITLTLGRGYPLRGRVTDAEGRPIPGALVLAGDSDPQGRLGVGEVPARAVTDAEGRYAFDGLPGRDRCLWAAFPGGTAVYAATIRFPAVSAFDIRLARGAPLTGTITDDDTGAPLAGVAVTVHERGLPVRFYGHARTDANGHYRIDTLPVGYVGALVLEKPGWAQVYGPFGEGIDTSRPAVLDGRMHRAGAIHGRVLGPDGPVAGAAVASMLQSGVGSLVVRNAITDAEGRFRFADLPEGTHVLGVRKEGYRSAVDIAGVFRLRDDKDHPSVVAVVRGTDVELDLKLTRGDIVVEGVVVGPDGSGFAGAEVHALGASATTADDGTFRLEGVQRQPNFTVLWVQAEGFVMAGPQPRVPDGADRLRDVRIGLKPAPPPAVVAGTVRDANGAVPRDVTVLVAKLPEKVLGSTPADLIWRDALRVHPDASGRFEAELPEGNLLKVRAVSPASPPSKTVNVIRAAGQLRHEVELVLEAGCTLEGTSLPGAYLSVREELKGMNKYRAAMAGGVASTIDAVADSEGAFRIEHLPAGRWEVVARRPGHADVSEVVVLPQTRALRLVPEAHVSLGGVVLFEDGAPVVGAKLFAWELEEDGTQRPGQGGQYGVVSGPGGRWRMDGLRPGRFRLVVQGNASANLIRHEDDSVRGGRMDLRVVVMRGLSVTGTVVDADGKGVAEIYVQIARDEGNVRRLYGWATSGPDGTFHLTGVPPGPSELTLRKGERRFTLKDVAGGATGLKITFDPTRDDLGRSDVRALAGVLLDEEDRPVVGRRILVKTVQPWRTATTDEKGRFSFTQLPEGRYPLLLERAREVGDVQYVADLGTFEAGATGLVARARRGLSIRGTVTDERGEPVAGVYVGAKAGHNGATVRTDASGRFELGGLPEGARALVRTWYPGRADDIRENVAAGTAGLALVLKAGLSAAGRVLDAKGQPVADTAVQFVLRGSKQRVSFARTDGAGRFEVRGLVPGRYDVSVAPEGRGYEACGGCEAGETGVELRLR